MKGMVGGKRKEHVKFLEAARQVARVQGVGESDREDDQRPTAGGQAAAQVLPRRRRRHGPVDLMGTGKGVARHAARVMAALDRLRAPENAARRPIRAAAADGVLVRRRRMACWCSGPSACRTVCSAAQSSTRTSTRGPRTFTKRRPALRAALRAPLLLLSAM
jgi:hypothetical protein